LLCGKIALRRFISYNRYVNKVMTAETIKKQIVPILKSQDIIKASVFGSFVNGEASENSDVDILIEYNKDNKKTLFDFVGLKFDLEKELKRKVDLLTYDSLNPLLKDIILNEQQVIYEKGA